MRLRWQKYLPYLPAFFYALAAYPVMRLDSEAVYALYAGFPLAFLFLFNYLFSYSLFVAGVVFVLPFSINYTFEGTGFSVWIPSEPLIGLACLAFGLLFFAGKKISRAFLANPLSFLVLLHLGWVGLSVFFSELPGVTLKALVVRISYILIFYFALGDIFIRKTDFLAKFYQLYAAGFTPVILYVLYRHGLEDFSKDYAGDAPTPFFSDHTIYSACLCGVTPFLWAYSFTREAVGRWKIEYLRLFFAVFFTVAVVLASSRAGWISLGLCLPLLLWLKLRLPFSGILVLLTAAGFGLWTYQEDLTLQLKINRADSNAKHSTVEDQLKSVGNIRSDVSNMERINRWSCAIRMAGERPWTGFGFGAYQFTYLPFQLSSEMTPISVRTPFNQKGGRGGNAHSDFLGQLAECGYPGLLIFSALTLYGLYLGFYLFYTAPTPEIRKAALVALLSLTTYVANGLFNSFLDVDKAACLFWGALALLAALDAQTRRRAFPSESTFLGANQ